MNYENYNKVIHNTASKDIHLDVVKASTARSVIQSRLEWAEDLDAVKKGMFYGKHQPGLTNYQNLRIPEAAPVVESNKYLVHSILGIDSESAELLEMLLNTVFEGKGQPAKDKIIDEAGDLFWYFTMLLKTVGVSLEEVMERNYKKLSARFPDGTFALDQWEGRDKTKEMKIMTDTIG